MNFEKELVGDKQSHRKEDQDGFIEVEENPISKVGVFAYSGKQISNDLPADKLFYVYRPAEELSKQETIDSFKLKPFIDEHEMIGKEFTPAEEKGVEGVIGEKVHFDGTYLKANLKIFSNNLNDLIKQGKKEVSLGYRCKYEPAKGVFNGQTYDFIQRDIRGNHIALVQEGRCGSDVAVLDRFTFDAAELLSMPEKLTLEALDEKLNKVISAMDEMKIVLDKKAKDEEEKEDKEDKKSEDEDMNKEDVKDEKEDEKEDKAKDEEEEEKMSKDKKAKDSKAKDSKAFDANEFKREVLKELTAKNELAEKLSWQIGVFDHSEKTLTDVASYGLEKLRLTAPKGAETAVLNAYLAGKTDASKGNVRSINAMDEADKNGSLNQILQKFKR